MAARLLSRKDSETVGVFGAGVQARTQLLALTEVRNIKRVFVYDPVAERAEQYAHEMTDKPWNPSGTLT